MEDITFTSNVLTEVTNTDYMYIMIKEIKNEINLLISNYLVSQDQEIHDVIENTL